MSMRRLSAQLLASDEIIGIVSRCCPSRDVGDFAFERAADAASCNITGESLDELMLSTGESVSHFRVDLMNSNARLAELDSWFIPERMREEHLRALADARVPLRSCLRMEQFVSRCFYVRFYDDQVRDDGSILFEHHIVTYESSTRRPVAISQDRYLRSLLADYCTTRRGLPEGFC
jgi:hypothetical protein